MWDATKIDLVVAPSWPAEWESGAVTVVPVSPSAEFALTPDGTGLVTTTSAGLAYEPERHLHLGTVVGRMVFAAVGEGPATNLRAVLTQVGETEVALALRAAALVQFHQRNRYCPACGSPTRIDECGHSRWCDTCGEPVFPRLDPAVIVAVTDATGRLLLGHHAGWEANRYSVFAGFTEAGESLEQTVRRELAEEVGLTVTDVRYFGSQPWPLPRSLMLGFTATVAGGELTPDGTEIEAASWFSRAEYRAGLADGTVKPPLTASIAYRLITAWLEG